MEDPNTFAHELKLSGHILMSSCTISVHEKMESTDFWGFPLCSIPLTPWKCLLSVRRTWREVRNAGGGGLQEGEGIMKVPPLCVWREYEDVICEQKKKMSFTFFIYNAEACYGWHYLRRCILSWLGMHLLRWSLPPAFFKSTCVHRQCFWL